MGTVTGYFHSTWVLLAKVQPQVSVRGYPLCDAVAGMLAANLRKQTYQMTTTSQLSARSLPVVQAKHISHRLAKMSTVTNYL